MCIMYLKLFDGLVLVKFEVNVGLLVLVVIGIVGCELDRLCVRLFVVM